MLNIDILTLVFLGLAVFVILKLRSVLGQRTGTERPPADLFERRPQANGASEPGSAGPVANNVVPLPTARRDGATPEARIEGVAKPDSPAYKGLIDIARADETFAPADFLTGARAAYEMIVTAFAGGDRRALKDLLSRDVYEGFEAAIRDRENRNEKVETQFVSIEKAEFADALLRVKSAEVTVKFQSKLITATRDAAGTVVEGNPEKVIDVVDIWTFARDITARDPNWRLIATESAQ